MKIFLFILGITIGFTQEDCEGDRYINEIFDVNVQYNIEYGENINQTLLGSNFTETLYLDVYSPANDEFNSRPIIFFMLRAKPKAE